MMPIRAVSQSRRGPSRAPLAALAAVAAAGCAGKSRSDAATPATAPQVQEVEMEPIKLQGVKGPDGVQHVVTYDATELFEQGGAALSEKRYDDSVAAYEHLLKEFPAEV